MQIELTPMINILLVEDNHDHAELIRRSLKSIKIQSQIFHMENGEKALDYLLNISPFEDHEEFPVPHLIILDIRLPLMNGIEFLNFVKQKERLKEIPVVILSTSRSEEDIRQAYQYHANSYLVKPTGSDKFSTLIHDLGYYWFKRNKLPKD